MICDENKLLLTSIITAFGTKMRASLLLMLLSLSYGLVNANPGLLSAIGKDINKFNMVLDGMASDSAFIESSDMGVKHWNFSFMVANPVYPHSPQELNTRLYLYMKYMVHEGVVTIKAIISAETRDVAKTPVDFYINPTFYLSTLPGAPFQHTHSFQARAIVHSYWDPPAQAAMVSSFETRIDLGSNWRQATHEWQFTSDVDPSPFIWTPATDVALLDGRGIHVPPVQPGGNKERETYVVLKPLYNFSTYVFGPLIYRHVEYYQSLGVSKHIIYLRRESIPALLLGNPKIARMVQKGIIILVLWDGLPQHELWRRRYDQRVVYSHAVLAFTGMDVYLINVDLDEYLVSAQPELQNQPIHKIIEACAGHPAEAKVMRYNTICKECDHSKGEAFLWGPAAAEQWPSRHPLSWYETINYASTSTGRSIVNPNFVRAFYITMASVNRGYNSTVPDGRCMFFLHIVNMLKPAVQQSKIDAHFVEDRSWMGMLQHFKAYLFPPEPPAPPPKPPAPRPPPPLPQTGTQ